MVLGAPGSGSAVGTAEDTRKPVGRAARSRQAELVGYARVSTAVTSRRLLGAAPDTDAVVAALVAAGWRVEVDESPAAGGVLLDGHESLGASRVPEVLLRVRIEREAAAGCDLVAGVLAVGNAGVAGLAVTVELDPDVPVADALAVHERRLADEVEQVLGVVEESLGGRHVADPPPADHPADGLPTGRILWWHRVVVLPTPGDVPSAHRVHCRRVPMDEGTDLWVGDGYSYFTGPLVTDDLVVQALRGILLATEDWLVLDSLNRRLAHYLGRLPTSYAATDPGTLSGLAADGLDFTVELDALQLYLEERNRYLSVGRRAAWTAAREQWGLDGEIGRLRDRAQSARDLAAGLATEVEAQVDRSRNTLLFVLAFATVADLSLSTFDFATDVPPEAVSVLRVLVAGAVLLVTGWFAAVSLRRGARVGRKGSHRRP